LSTFDTEQIHGHFLGVDGQGIGVNRAIVSVWREAGFPIVEGAAPTITTGGKILRIRLERRSSLGDGLRNPAIRN
jgi:hypothetical protein